MKVGLLIYGSLDTLSGGYLYDRKLAEFLRCQGDQVEVISIPWRNYSLHLMDNFFSRVLQALKTQHFDLMLQDELNHPSLFRFNRALKRSIDYPLISIVHHLRSSEHHPPWLMPVYRRVEGAYLQTIDGFILNSETTRRAVEHCLGKKPLPGHVVAQPGGDRLPIRVTDEQVIDRARWPGPLRLLFLGNLIPRKGLHTLLDALYRIPSQNWQLTVAGRMDVDRKYSRTILKDINAHGWNGKIQFLGLVRDEDLISQLSCHHVLVMPSHYEGFGIAYLEGMAYGLPAIGTAAGGAREIITDGKDGCLIPPGDSGRLAKCLSLLHQDRKWLSEMGLAARKRFAAQPTWSASLQQIRVFLRSFL